MAVTVGMYSAQRTSAQMTRLPRFLPLSLARGARPGCSALWVYPFIRKTGGEF